MESNKDGGPRKTAWGKRLVIILGVLAGVLLVAYLVVTSSAFIKAVVLPRVGAAINAKVTAEDVSLRPFSQLQLSGLRVDTTGPEPLLTAREFRVRYSLVDILGGNINVNEVMLDTPVVNIVAQADGTSNLDPVLDGESTEEPPSKDPIQLSVRNVSLKNGTVRQVQMSSDGGRKITEIRAMNITLDQLGNGQRGKLTLEAGLNVEQKNGGSNDVLRGTLSGGYTIALNRELLPQTVSGSTRLAITSGQGLFADLQGMNGSIEAELTPTELKRVALLFARNEQRLGEIRASGPLDLEKMEGNVRIEILSLGPNAFALATAGSGLDFRQTEINSTNQITLSQGGTFLAANGILSGNRISIAQGDMVTPETDLKIEYQGTINTSDQSAVLQRLNISGSSGGRPFLRTDLDRQMNLSWGETLKGYRDAALRVAITNFSLAEWRPVLGTNIASGVANANISLVARQDGRQLMTTVAAQIDDLSASFGTNQIRGTDISLNADGMIEQLKSITLNKYSFAISEDQQPLLRGDGAGRYQLETGELSIQANAQGELPRLLALLPLTNVTARAGRLDASATFSQAAAKQTALGTLVLRNFTGSYDAYQFENYQASFDYNVEMDEQRVEINRFSASLSQGFNSGGALDLKGRYDLQENSGQFDFNTVDLNHHGLRPFLAPALGENQLISISLTTLGQAKIDAEGENALKATVKIANWVVKDPAGTLPQTPLSAELNVHAGMQQAKLDLHEFGLKLSPTPRAKNELIVQGKLDLGTNNPAPSTLAVRAESLDLTPYYNMFAGGTNAAAEPDATAAPAAESEPEPIELPFRQLAAELKIDQLYLREVAISNWTGKLNIISNVVQLKPFKLQVNGGDMSATATIDTGVAGYRYDVAFNAGSVPLLPLANSFGSGATNQLDGLLIADAHITGAGTTGPNLRKNLGGQFSANLTNLNLELVGPRLRRIIVPISLALRVPELAQTPVNWVAARAAISNGVVDLSNFAVQSEAFFAESTGTIALADVMTNSTLNLPLNISLRRSLAEKTRILPPNTPTNAAYAPLPQFASIKGTIGAPEVDLNKLAIAGILARGAAGFGLGNDKTEQALGQLGDLLTGQRGTNAPTDTNASPAGNLLRSLGGLLGGDKSTNNAASGTNAPAPRSPLDLLRPRSQPENN